MVAAMVIVEMPTRGKKEHIAGTPGPDDEDIVPLEPLAH
jgi:hypothetical protein